MSTGELSISTMRAQVLTVYQAALRAVHGRDCVRTALSARPITTPLCAVAVGKAAAAMAQGAYDALGEQVVAALVISKHGYVEALAPRPGLTVLEAGHPVPDAHSLQAGVALLRFLADESDDATLLFLISGGTSSLVEVLPEGVTLADVQRTNDWLLASGWDIGHMNALRKRLSCIKGGRLMNYIGERRVLQLLISDVPGDNPGDIGSGLLVPHAAGDMLNGADLPQWLQSLLGKATCVPSCAGPASTAVETRIVASLGAALAAAARRARELGHVVHKHEPPLCGAAEEVGARIAQALLDGPPGVHLWGGETTVVLPPKPGRGGRNQHLALSAATVLAGHDAVCLLAAATDGSDGPGVDAGALVDGGTIARGACEDLNAQACLRRADAGTYLEASGDLVNTGPTGTNVMDVVIGWRG